MKISIWEWGNFSRTLAANYFIQLSEISNETPRYLIIRKRRRRRRSITYSSRLSRSANETSKSLRTALSTYINVCTAGFLPTYVTVIKNVPINYRASKIEIRERKGANVRSDGFTVHGHRFRPLTMVPRKRKNRWLAWDSYTIVVNLVHPSTLKSCPPAGNLSRRWSRKAHYHHVTWQNGQSEDN